ncbi:MAG: ABC transporter permease [Bacteroidota bacterium]|nr:ABC transporter permease [Bacteroidota bacterium]
MNTAHTATENTENWTLTIKPKAGLLELNLSELWRYRDLILLFVRRDFVAVYKQTILGPLWFIIQPLLTTITFTIIFGNIAKIPTDGLPPILFYMSGLILWNYFSTCLTKSSNTFITNSGVFGKVYFPRLVVPIADSISNLISFGIQFVTFIGLFVFYYLKGGNIHPNMFILLLPFLLFLMAGIGLGLGIIVSSLTTKYRDLTFLVSFGVQLFMYATPVIFPSSSVPESIKKYLWFNPITPIIETFRYGILGSGMIDWMQLGYSCVFMIIVLLLGIVMFNKVEKNFMDVI